MRRRAGAPRLPRRPLTLRARLVVSAVSLIAVVCAVIGTVTTIALHSHLYAQVDERLGGVTQRAAGGPPPGRPRGGDPLLFVTTGPQDLGTLGAVVDASGRVTRAVISEEAEGEAEGNGAAGSGAGGGAGGGAGDTVGAHGAQGVQSGQGAQGQGGSAVRARVLGGASVTALAKAARDGHPHSVDVPGLGSYRVQYVAGRDGDFLVGTPTEEADATVRTLIVVEVCVTLAGLLAASFAGAALVSVALRPLRRVAATATRVAELPLHQGEVALVERVPEAQADARTEVGRVGAALNRMLDHVHAALDARQESETRVRRFVADASHELRTPLASILGYAELTRRTGEPTGPDTRHALDRIESQAGRMAGLVEDLLLLARLDAGHAEGTGTSTGAGGGTGTAKRPGTGAETGAGAGVGAGVAPLCEEGTDLVPLLVDAVSDARVAGPAHLWRLALPGEAEPVPVRGDPARLQQVLGNLLANARTHTPPGTRVTARVRTEEEGAGPGGVPPAPGQAVLEVEDDGPGIEPALLPSVFERFARGDVSRARASGTSGTSRTSRTSPTSGVSGGPVPGASPSGSTGSGSTGSGSTGSGSTGSGSTGSGSTGLGLAIVRALVTAHGGTVEVRSVPGRTVFTVRLPLLAPPGGRAAPVGADRAHLSGEGHRLP